MKVKIVKSIEKIEGETDLFRDIDENVVRYRMHCPQCGVVSGCRCFKDLFTAQIAISDGCDCICSYKCALLYDIDNTGIEEILEAMKTISIRWRIKAFIYKLYSRLIEDISEKDAKEFYDKTDADFDDLQGEAC